MPRKEQGWITFQTSEEERKLLEEVCQHSQRTKTEILRELVRSLSEQQANPAPAETPSPSPDHPAQATMLQVQEPPLAVGDVEIASRRKALKISSRNVLQGKVKRIVTGAVNSEVTLEIVHKVELVSIITRASAEDLGLVEGSDAYAVIKSTDVAIAME